MNKKSRNLSESQVFELLLSNKIDISIQLEDANKSLDLSHFFSSIKFYVLPSHIVPLSFERQPFAKLSDELIQFTIKNAINYPEKVGLLTDAIRRVMNFKISRPSPFVVSEAHIDLTTVDEKLRESLLRLGFEFDNFYKIQPEKYKHHFTLKYCINPKHKHRARELFNLVTDCSLKAANLIQKHDGVDGYVETEVYSSKDSRKYEFRPIEREALEHFPFTPKSFQLLELPLNNLDAQSKGLSINTHRVADIHIKIPSHVNHKQFVELESVEMTCLKDKLKSCGFYEIISESANYIYTAHFYNTVESIFVFEKLAEFANNWGGFTEVTREICTNMWRKQTLSFSGITLAEAPPILSLVKQHN